MLKQYEYNGYIGEAELSKNRKKTKVPFFQYFWRKLNMETSGWLLGRAPC